MAVHDKISIFLKHKTDFLFNFFKYIVIAPTRFNRIVFDIIESTFVKLCVHFWVCVSVCPKI